jgi:hypothetical protein
MIVSSFIIQANVIMIVNYDRQTFIVQATVFELLLILLYLKMLKISDSTLIGPQISKTYQGLSWLTGLY